MKRSYTVYVRGRVHKWGYRVWAKPAYVESWRDDGIDVVENIYVFPEWWVEMGLPLRPLAFFQDLFNGRNPFER